MRNLPRLYLAVIVLAANSTAAERLGDPHLSVLPRTDSERKHITAVTAPTADFTTSARFEANQGGAATVRARTTSDAFSQPSGNISFEKDLDFKVGNGLFKKLWVSSPSSTLASDGLGPLYNARSCQRCHLKDGRGHPTEGQDDAVTSMLVPSIRASHSSECCRDRRVHQHRPRADLWRPNAGLQRGRPRGRGAVEHHLRGN